MHDVVSAMARGEKFQARKAAAAGFGAAIRVHLAWAEPDALAASHRGDEKPPPLSHFPHAPQIGLKRSSHCCDFATLQFATTASLFGSERLLVWHRLLYHSQTCTISTPCMYTIH